MKHLILLKNQNKIDIKKLLFRWFITSLIKKTYGSATKNENMLVQQLPEELQKKNIRKFKKRKVQSPFRDNIWGSHLLIYS